jgi:hypothetical protein
LPKPSSIKPSTPILSPVNPTERTVSPVANYPPKIPAPAPVAPAGTDLRCEGCDCTKLLTQLSIGVKPLTTEQNAFIQTHCQ